MRGRRPTTPTPRPRSQLLSRPELLEEKAVLLEVPVAEELVDHVAAGVLRQPESEHPHGLPDSEFDSLFTTDRPVVFAYHGYPWLIHRLTYRRTNHANLHVRGYKEEGTTTTPFDMVMLNDLDRYHLVIDGSTASQDSPTVPATCGRRWRTPASAPGARAYGREHGEDDPNIAGWSWQPRTRGQALLTGGELYESRLFASSSIRSRRV